LLIDTYADFLRFYRNTILSQMTMYQMMFVNRYETEVSLRVYWLFSCWSWDWLPWQRVDRCLHIECTGGQCLAISLL